jgi:hypothetical protein
MDEMHRNQSSVRMPFILTAGYLVLVLLAFLLTVIAMKQTPLAGIYLVTLTMPWCFIDVVIRLVTNTEPSTSTTFLLSMVYAAVNASLIFYVSTLMSKRKRRNS